MLQSTLTIIYFLAAAAAAAIAYDFYRSTDGKLRVILIQLFCALSLRYFTYFLANMYEFSLDWRLWLGVIVVPLEIVFLSRLWAYIKWKK